MTGWEWLEIARTVWKWQENKGAAGNGLKTIKMTMGWPYHSFDCVFLLYFEVSR